MTIQEAIFTFTTSFVALFPVINPIGNGFIINSFLGDLDGADRKRMVGKIVLNALLIAIGSLAAGQIILLIFGLAVPVIQIAGGILICRMGFEWLTEPDKPKQAEVSDDTVKKLIKEELDGKLFYPIAFPICIGPGAMSVIFTLMATSNVKGDWLATGLHYVIIAVAIAVVLSILYLFLTQSRRITKKLGNTGNKIINKLIAFITFCLGIQIIIMGVSKAFHITVL